MELIEREREILRILDKLKNTDFILVGGYAVSSLTIHRLSVDCDLVVSKSLDKIRRAIRYNSGFVRHFRLDYSPYKHNGRNNS